MKFIKGAKYRVVTPMGNFDVVYKRPHPEYQGQSIFKLHDGQDVTLITAHATKDEFILISEPPVKKTFNLVFSRDGEKPPKRRIPSFKAACKVAKKMAQKHPGQKFYVVTSQVRFHVPEGTSEVVYEQW